MSDRLTADTSFAAYLMATGRYMDQAACVVVQGAQGPVVHFAFDLRPGETMEALHQDFRQGAQVSAHVYAQASKTLKALLHRMLAAPAE